MSHLVVRVLHYVVGTRMAANVVGLTKRKFYGLLSAAIT